MARNFSSDNVTPACDAVMAAINAANHGAVPSYGNDDLTARLQARDQIEQQIYALLTAEQKSQFASILAARQAKMAQHSAS